MDKYRYFIEMVKQDNGYKLKWIRDMFTYLKDDKYDDEFVKKDGKVVIGKIDDNEDVVLDSNYSKALFHPTDTITIDSNDIPLVNGKIETTVGRLLMNYLLLYKCFGNKIEYKNEQFSISDIESYIEANLVNDDDPEKDKKITVSEYIKFVDTVTYIKNFNRLYSLSATKRSIVPPPGIDEYKKKLLSKYTKEELEDKTIVAKIEEELMKYEMEYIKKDPSYGKLVRGKVLGARKKMYTSYGLGMEFTPSPKAKYVTESLSDGYPKDKKKLAILFNDSRLGSYSRGAETQKGGVTAKYSLRATNNIKILKEDCKTKLYKEFLVTDSNYKSIVNRYMFDNNYNNVLIDNDKAKSLIGKTIRLRTPQYCKTEHHFCVYCMGEGFKDYETGISLLVLNISDAILNESLKKMHSTNISLTEINMDDMLT